MYYSLLFHSTIVCYGRVKPILSQIAVWRPKRTPMHLHLKSKEGEENLSQSAGNLHAAGPSHSPSEHYSGTTCHSLQCGKAGAGCIWSSFRKWVMIISRDSSHIQSTLPARCVPMDLHLLQRSHKCKEDVLAW